MKDKKIITDSMNKLYVLLLMINFFIPAPVICISSLGEGIWYKIPLFIYLLYEFSLLALFPFELYKFIKKYKKNKEDYENGKI